jgi:hypothetical protein
MAQNAPIRRSTMTQASTGFASVKLPAALVNQAREAAQPMRRSVAGQVEYWATLGRIVEHSGLTAQEAQERAYWESHDSTEHLDWSKAKKATLPNLSPRPKPFRCDCRSTCWTR